MVETGYGIFACKQMLYLHRILGCETTFNVYGISKAMIKENQRKICFQQVADQQSMPAHIDQAGEQAMVII